MEPEVKKSSTSISSRARRTLSTRKESTSDDKPPEVISNKDIVDRKKDESPSVSKPADPISRKKLSGVWKVFVE